MGKVGVPAEGCCGVQRPVVHSLPAGPALLVKDVQPLYLQAPPCSLRMSPLYLQAPPTFQMKSHWIEITYSSCRLFQSRPQSRHFFPDKSVDVFVWSCFKPVHSLALFCSVPLSYLTDSSANYIFKDASFRTSITSKE